MHQDDIIYMALLIFSIGFGKFYQTIYDKRTRKYVGTLVGLLIVFLVSGYHIIHLFLMYIANSIIIKVLSPDICHKASFGFSFLYLFFFRTTEYFGIPYPPPHTNIMQMILTLKLVGLALEVNTSQSHKIDTSEEVTLEEKFTYIDPGFVDIFHYSFNYIGVIAGPYYKYKTFQDSFNLPFGQFTNNWDFTLSKLIFLPLYVILYLLSSYIWPLSYALTDEFYHERSWLYRYWYIWPNFFIFRMRMYAGLVLSECVCTMGGMGIYPTFTNPKPGGGPSENLDKLKNLSENSEMMVVEKYNYTTIHNVSPYGADFCTTYREGMKHWNMCIQYWLAVNVYKRWPNKKNRTAVTMMVSAMWHGVYLGYYVCIGTVPFVLAIEDVWVGLLLKNKEGSKLKINEWVVWFFKMHFFSYQAIAFHLLSVGKIIKYYNSIGHAGFILGLVLYAVGVTLTKKLRRKDGDQVVAGSSKVHAS